jgi:hypothetical protein
MAKPDVTLQPSKGIVAQAAAEIYSAYICAGRVDDAEIDQWIKRSIREAITIARTVDAAVMSDAELPAAPIEPQREAPLGSEE